ncbi:twin-arginine translocation signal domain-containing protein [Arabiibacter massiliensis]|uniref:twin-arginine translocation signal domain-containing protein n=1 Tax=Arabiibacter massiliensis TaxID=1870985 RepID=UPI0009BC0CE0|nr:twin-arginine translocation signal domain-containing protein [Arabiibacter massiliensis]
MELQFSRRDFLKGSIVVALGTAGVGMLSSCAGGNAAAETSAPAAAGDAADATGTVTLHRGYGAAHGDKCFTRAVVATADDGTILAASVDDYQFMAADSAGIAGVPNSDAGFGEGYAEGKMLVSKAGNDEAYSAMMKEKAQATKAWGESMAAIEAFCVGKKASELTKAGIDAVSGATLVDAPNYLKLVAQVAESTDIATTGTYSGDGADLKLGAALTAAHGDKAFAEAVSLVQGDVLVASSIDEFQFTGADTADLVPVPNSDAAFAEGYAEGKALMSKSVNSDMYSAMMKEKAQATTPWIDSIAAIESFVAGQKIADVKVQGPDAVSGATLVDAAGYANAAVVAAQAA